MATIKGDRLIVNGERYTYEKIREELSNQAIEDNS